VSIVVQCPHCKTRFNLQSEMNGKSMRCPNLECRQVFTVKAMEEKAPAPSYEIPPEPAHEPPAKPPKPTKPGASKPPKPPKPTRPAGKSAEPEVVEGVVEAAVVSGPKVKEVVWSEGTDVPPPKKRKAGAEDDEPETVPDDLPVRRKRKHSRGPLVLAVMLVGIVAAVLFAAFYILYFQTKDEENLAARAKGEYEKGSYADAAKTYDKLTKEHSGSKKIDEYKFFADLSSMQVVVRGVTNREDYDAAVKRLDEFIEAQKESPLSKPGTGFGHDVLEAGKKLGEDIAAHADDRVQAFQKDRTKSGELERADKAIKAGRKLIDTLNPFRAADDPPLDGLKAALEKAEKGVKRERDRTAAIARAKAQLENPTDAVIQTVEAELSTANLLDDPEAQQLIAAAKGKLRDLVKYEADPADPQPAPPSAAASLLFVTPIGKTKVREAAPNDSPASVFLCVARGILYAIDENGELLWTARVGPDVTDPPAVARITLATGPTEIAVVTSNVGNAPAVTGYRMRPSDPRDPPLWYQSLPAPAAGPAIVVGTRAFVPVRDALGTVFEFDLTSGARVGKIRLGQPVADRAAVLRPGTNLLYVAADARRLYILDTGGKDDDGNRVNPRCAQVIATGHLSGTLRVPPLFIGPEGTEPADRWMILAQAEGTSKTLLRAFRVEPIGPPPAAGASIPETPAAHAIALPVPGWVTFPPVCDGERLAVATDTGQFRLFGVNQPGNADKTLFPFPAPSGATLPAEKTIPGVVIPVEESTYWVLAAGQLQRARLAMLPSKGQTVALSGAPLPMGEPVHAAQVNARRDIACVVVRSLNSSGCRAVAIDMKDGEIRWQRQLGLVPAKLSADAAAPPINQAGKFILVDEDGGIVAVPAAAGVTVGQTVPAQPAWVLASPPPNATGPTLVVPSADGKTVYTLTPVNREGPKFVIRRIADGKLAHEDEAVAPAALAGQSAIVGGSLLIPTADGFVNRLIPGDGRVRPGTLVAGPPWLGERKHTGACCITPLSDTTFATSDGGKKVSRWDWPATAGGKWTLANAWDIRQEVTGTGVSLPPAAAGEPPRLAIADSSGSVWLYASDRAGGPLMRWMPGGESAIPAGKPSSGLTAQAGMGRIVVVYAVDGKAAAAIDPNAEEALWAARTADDAAGMLVGAPQPAGEDRWVLTDLAGRVVVIDGANGAVLATQSVGLPGAVPAAPSGVVANSALTPLSDGSAVVIELPKKEPFVPPK
jgi:hypothetical protein